MNTKENLYKTLFKGQAESPNESFQRNMSPMSSLAQTLFGATLTHTPRKRLSLSSSISCTPSFLEASFGSVDTNTSLDNVSKSSEKSPVMQTSSSMRFSPRNKENVHTPYYSPSHRRLHKRKSPLKEVQNTVNRNLSFSPLKKPISPSKREHLSPVVKKHFSIEDCDSNSRDSGYSESDKKGYFLSDQKSDDGFSIPRSCAPTRRLNLDMSPKKSPPSSTSDNGGRRIRSFASLTKQSDDAMIIELLGDDFNDDDEPSPTMSFTSLLSAPIQTSSPFVPTPTVQRLPIRRCLSMIDTTPLTSRVKINENETSFEFACTSSPKAEKTACKIMSPFSPTEMLTPGITLSFKRPQPPSDFTPCPVQAKRRRSEFTPLSSLENKQIITQRQYSSPETRVAKVTSEEEPEGRPRIQRSHSESHVSIMKALNNSSKCNGDMTGDFSRPLALPVIQAARHPDLKSIDSHTLAKLIKGQYNDKISSFEILDCRYPYEFQGGHISKAQNWHHPKMVIEHLETCTGAPKAPSVDGKRKILIFHCEFSAERGPRAQRLLREFDRTANKEYYPLLHYPELYLLEGGYKSFYEDYPELCSPEKYVKMLDEKHSEDLKLFRSKSKSWASENKSTRNRRTGPKRLGS